MNLRKFTVHHVSSFKMGDMPKILGEHRTWSDAVTQVLDAVDRKNMVITECCAGTKNHHAFWFNEDGLAVSVDHFCNDTYCQYGDLESLNR